MPQVVSAFAFGEQFKDLAAELPECLVGALSPSRKQLRRAELEREILKKATASFSWRCSAKESL
jgi:hypothetical protein